MTITISLSEKQEAAFAKRISTGTAEELAITLITDTAQKWADDDYAATAAQLAAALKDQPQSVLDGIITQLEAVA
jgi:outer membrane receptor for ferric coprogen and ferric-rhodotorulic acid